MAGPILYLKLNDTLIPSIRSVSSANTTYQATTTSLTSAKDDKVRACVTFDGTNSRIQFPNIACPTDFTFSAWLKRTSSVTGVETLLAFGDGAPAFELNGEKPRISGGASYDTAVASNAWTHVAVTKSGTTTKLYTDGTLRNTGATSTTTTSGTGLSLGKGASGNAFGGQMAHVAVFDYALTDAGITNLYNKPLGLVPAMQLPLVNIVDGSVLDISGNRRHGIAQNLRLECDVAFGMCSRLNGTNSSIDIPQLFTPEKMTFTAWIKTSSNQGTIFSTDGGIQFGMTGTTTSPTIGWKEGTSTASNTSKTVNASWNHVAFTRDTTNVTVYLNGENIITSNTRQSMGRVGRIGCAIDGTLPFKGEIANVMLFDEALSPEWIQLTMV